MKLKTAYIIDGDVIEDLKTNHSELRDNAFDNGRFETAQRHQGILDGIELLEQHLKPALPILESVWEESATWKGWITDTECEGKKQDFLSKDF